MKWTITTPPASRVLTWYLAKTHLRLDSDMEQTYVEGLIDAADDFAQESMACSLVSQGITAVYYADDVEITPGPRQMASQDGMGGFVPMAVPFYGSSGRAPMLKLPRGPVSAIGSVIDGGGRTITAYELERKGHCDRLRLTTALTFPVTVVFTAGFGTASQVPAGIRQAMLLHVGTLYENRESVGKGVMLPVPHSLEAFYRLKRRTPGVG